MAGVLVNECKTLMLDERLANPPFDDLELGLFTGATIPTVATVLADLTEVTGTGYARQAITGWLPAILLGDGHASSQANQVTFTNSGGSPWDEATGWFWYAPTAVVLVRAARFPVSFILPAGGSYPLVPFDLLTGE